MQPFKRILAPTDFSEPSYRAIDDAAALARQTGAELVIVHVTQIVPPIVGVPPFPEYTAFNVGQYEEAIRENAESTLREVTARPALQGVNVRTALRRGNAADEIVAEAKAEGADLIVIATHGVTGWRRYIFGSVTDRVLRLADVPVLVTPTEEPADHA